MPKAARIAKTSPHASTRIVAERIAAAGEISRAELARVAGLSKQTVSDAVRDLERQGWLRASGQSRGALGRSATTYRIRNEAAFVFACDLGGTKLHIALADFTGAVVAEMLEPTDQRSGKHLLSQIRSMTGKLARKARLARDRVRLAVVGIAGVVDPRSGRLAFGPNVPPFGSANVIDGMRRAFGCDVVIENDVNLAVLGEYWRGRGQGVANLAFIALGTGIGMGLLANGALVRGAHGAAAEIGYLPIAGDPFEPRNVAEGAFESVVGTDGILQRYRAAGGGAVTGVRDILEALNSGDKIARKVIDDTARWTAIGIAAVAALLDPELVVLGGGIGTRPELISRIEAHLARCLLRPVPVVPSPLENRATLLGAVATGLDQIYAQAFGAHFLKSHATISEAA
jgi:predicted NBD/HSP70 family sugar kinase